MKIYACGCSFTYGDELANPNLSSWPALLSQKLKSEIVNDACLGGTNSRTIYRTIKNLKNNYDLYLIAWTDYSRFTFYKSDNNFEINFNTNLAHDLYQDKFYYKEWGEILYSHWFNELYAFKLWLQQIVQLQKVLQGQNYIMVNTAHNELSKWLANKENFIDNVRPLINFDSMTDQQIFDEHDEIQYYISLIDKSKFYGWNKFYITQLCNEFKYGPRGHLLEDGHQHLADLIYTHVQNKTPHS